MNALRTLIAKAANFDLLSDDGITITGILCGIAAAAILIFG